MPLTEDEMYEKVNRAFDPLEELAGPNGETLHVLCDVLTGRLADLVKKVERWSDEETWFYMVHEFDYLLPGNLQVDLIEAQQRLIPSLRPGR